MFECSGPAAATGTSRATGITWLSEAASAANDGFDAVPEACHAEPVVSQRADVWQAAAALPAPVGPPVLGGGIPGYPRAVARPLGVQVGVGRQRNLDGAVDPARGQPPDRHRPA